MPAGEGSSRCVARTAPASSASWASCPLTLRSEKRMRYFSGSDVCSPTSLLFSAAITAASASRRLAIFAVWRRVFRRPPSAAVLGDLPATAHPMRGGGAFRARAGRGAIAAL
jgi:hypothetical protein